MIKRLLIAALFALGLGPAFGQVPPPVPALPDTERRTSYNLSASTCACAVNFAIFGDSSDFQNWIEVWLNGAQVAFNDPASGWTVTSPTGPLATIPRPVTDAILTFNATQTGTVQIVGARRPRRASQFQENQGVSARNLNQVVTDIVAMLREDWDKINDITGRGLFFAPGNVAGAMPTPTQCASGLLGFDVTGLNPKCYPITSGGGTGIIVSPVRNGDIPYWNGAAWTTLPGNNSGTNVLTESNTGIPSWAAGGGGGGGTACIQDFLSGAGFTAGVTTALTTTCAVGNAASLSIFFDGVRQNANTWSLSTLTVTFSAAIPTGTQVVEFQAGAPGSGVTGPVSSTTNDIATFNGASGSVIKDSGISIASLQAVGAPQGRLTAQLDTPIQSAVNLTAVSQIWYAPSSRGNKVFIGGAAFTITSGNTDLDGLPLTLGTYVVANTIYDIFAISVAGTPTLCVGPAWTTSTMGAGARSAAGAVGPYNPYGGIQVNTNAAAMSCKYGAGAGTTASVAQYQGTEVGEIIGSGTGTISAQIAPPGAPGGTNTTLGYCNTYNQEPIKITVIDSTAPGVFLYASASYRFANGSANNAVNFLTCPWPRQVTGSYLGSASGNGGAASALTLGIGLDEATATGFTGAGYAGAILGQAAMNSGSIGNMQSTGDSFTPSIGLHRVNGVEQATAAGVLVYYGDFGRVEAQTWF